MRDPNLPQQKVGVFVLLTGWVSWAQASSWGLGYAHEAYSGFGGL